MKKIFIGLGITASFLFGAETIKAVFDCAAKDPRFIASRMFLIEESAKELKAKNIPYTFVLTIHSGCTPIITEEIGDDEVKKGISQRLKILHHQYGVKIQACEIAMERFGIEKSDLPEYVGSVHNSITRVIELQNSGYAFIPYH
ncbi:DsrE family protein [Sulfuricurvum sp.]|uniref:DsrE family protein n=1 Tax=Sulfuricurvum sp. TaxID=2025608 RepID=UPI00286D9E47|nr:DsrE family protein [Sulfuricurvum sp.]